MVYTRDDTYAGFNISAFEPDGASYVDDLIFTWIAIGH
jgi:hypothetical protein